MDGGMGLLLERTEAMDTTTAAPLRTPTTHMARPHHNGPYLSTAMLPHKRTLMFLPIDATVKQQLHTAGGWLGTASHSDLVNVVLPCYYVYLQIGGSWPTIDYRK